MWKLKKKEGKFKIHVYKYIYILMCRQDFKNNLKMCFIKAKILNYIPKLFHIPKEWAKGRKIACKILNPKIRFNHIWYAPEIYPLFICSMYIWAQ